MKVLLLNCPTADPRAYEPPAGLLYFGSSLRRAGFEPTILDLQMKFVNLENILRLVLEGGYEAVGFGGISTSYWYVKRAAKLIRDSLPQVHLVAGGVLSSVWHLLLEHTPVDVVCFGEGETGGVEVFRRLKEGGRDFEGILGIAFRKNGKPVRTAPRDYLENLDDIPFPDYSLLNMEEYLLNPMDDLMFVTNKSAKEFYRKGMKSLNIKTARGCTNRCSFCYRHFSGHRQHSVEYVINHIKYVRDRFNVNYLRFGDELFTRDPEWVLALCDRLEAENLDIRFIIHGVRTDNVSRKLLKRLVEVGCVGTNFGFESGSQVILEEMLKNTTVEQNINAVQLANEVGMDMFVFLVVGMPSETHETIQETARALVTARVPSNRFGPNFAQAYPGTKLYHWARTKGYIPDEDRYMDRLGQTTDYPFNFTKVPTRETRKWPWVLRKAVLSAEAKESGRLADSLKTWHPLLYGAIVNYQERGLTGLKLSFLRKVGLGK